MYSEHWGIWGLLHFALWVQRLPCFSLSKKVTGNADGVLSATLEAWLGSA